MPVADPRGAGIVCFSFIFICLKVRTLSARYCIAAQDRLCTAVFIEGEFKIIHKEKESSTFHEGSHSNSVPPPCFKDSNTLLVDKELEPISRRRGVFVHV